MLSPRYVLRVLYAQQLGYMMHKSIPVCLYNVCCLYIPTSSCFNCNSSCPTTKKDIETKQNL